MPDNFGVIQQWKSGWSLWATSTGPKVVDPFGYQHFPHLDDDLREIVWRYPVPHYISRAVERQWDELVRFGGDEDMHRVPPIYAHFYKGTETP